MSTLVIHYAEHGGKAISVPYGTAVPAVRVSDGALVIVRYDDDLSAVVHTRSVVASLSSRRILAEFPGVTLYRFSRTDMMTIVIPCADFENVKSAAEKLGLRVSTIHADEVAGGAVWAGVSECLHRHYWSANTVWERQAAQHGRLLPGATGNRGMSASEVHQWVHDVMHVDYHGSFDDTTAALAGLARVGRALVEERGETPYYRLNKNA